MAPPPLFFQLGFYVGALSFAVAFGATLMAGGPPDTGILRGVQALMTFVILGWLAELVANTAPPPRRAAEQPRADEISAPAPVVHRAPIQERDRAPLPPYIASADDGDEGAMGASEWNEPSGFEALAGMPAPGEDEGPLAGVAGLFNDTEREAA